MKSTLDHNNNPSSAASLEINAEKESSSLFSQHLPSFAFLKLHTPSLNFSQFFKIYEAYNLFGATNASGLGAALIADSACATAFGGRHNFSLGFFWGNVAYKTINQIKDSNLIPPPYKMPLYLACAFLSLRIALKCENTYKSDYSFSKTLQAVTLTTSFFDKNELIPQITESFKEGYISRVIFCLKNLKGILSNNYISSLLIKQILDISKTFLVERMFNVMPVTKLSVIYVLKENKGIKYIIKSNLWLFVQKIIDLSHIKLT